MIILVSTQDKKEKKTDQVITGQLADLIKVSVQLAFSGDRYMSDMSPHRPTFLAQTTAETICI